MAVRTAANINKPTISTGSPPPSYKGVVTLRIKAQKYGPSSSGNPMITLTTEIVAPGEVKSDLDGNVYDLTGQEFDYYLMLNEVDGKGKPSPNLYNFANELLPKLGLPTEFDDANPLAALQFVGICFEALVGTRQRKEQKKNADGSYSPLVDGTGKEIVKGWEWVRQTGDILRKVETVAGRPY